MPPANDTHAHTNTRTQITHLSAQQITKQVSIHPIPSCPPAMQLSGYPQNSTTRKLGPENFSKISREILCRTSVEIFSPATSRHSHSHSHSYLYLVSAGAAAGGPVFLPPSLSLSVSVSVSFPVPERLRIQFNFYLYLFSFSLTICSGCKNFVRFLTTCEAKRKKQQSEREVEGNACCTAAAAPVAVVAVHLIIATVAV